MPEASVTSSSSSSNTALIYGAVGSLIAVGVIATIVAVAFFVIKKRRSQSDEILLSKRKTLSQIEARHVHADKRRSTMKRGKKPNKAESVASMVSMEYIEDDGLALERSLLHSEKAQEDRKRRQERAKVAFQEKVNSILETSAAVNRNTLIHANKSASALPSPSTAKRIEKLSFLENHQLEKQERKRQSLMSKDEGAPPPPPAKKGRRK